MSPQTYRRDNDERERPVSLVEEQQRRLEQDHRERALLDLLETQVIQLLRARRVIDDTLDHTRDLLDAWDQLKQPGVDIHACLAGVQRGRRNDGNFGGGA